MDKIYCFIDMFRPLWTSSVQNIKKALAELKHTRVYPIQGDREPCSQESIKVLCFQSQESLARAGAAIGLNKVRVHQQPHLGKIS